MTILLVKNTAFNLQTFYGDSGSVTIENIPTDRQDYTLYMEINGENTVQKVAQPNGEASVIIDFTIEDIKSLGQGQWSYGVKIASSDTEDTYIPDYRVASQALFIVKPQVVEGPTNE